MTTTTNKQPLVLSLDEIDMTGHEVHMSAILAILDNANTNYDLIARACAIARLRGLAQPRTPGKLMYHLRYEAEQSKHEAQHLDEFFASGGELYDVEKADEIAACYGREATLREYFGDLALLGVQPDIPFWEPSEEEEDDEEPDEDIFTFTLRGHIQVRREEGETSNETYERAHDAIEELTMQDSTITEFCISSIDLYEE